MLKSSSIMHHNFGAYLKPGLNVFTNSDIIDVITQTRDNMDHVINVSGIDHSSASEDYDVQCKNYFNMCTPFTRDDTDLKVKRITFDFNFSSHRQPYIFEGTRSIPYFEYIEICNDDLVVVLLSGVLVWNGKYILKGCRIRLSDSVILTPKLAIDVEYNDCISRMAKYDTYYNSDMNLVKDSAFITSELNFTFNDPINLESASISYVSIYIPQHIDGKVSIVQIDDPFNAVLVMRSEIGYFTDQYAIGENSMYEFDPYELRDDDSVLIGRLGRFKNKNPFRYNKKICNDIIRWRKGHGRQHANVDI